MSHILNWHLKGYENKSGICVHLNVYYEIYAHEYYDKLIGKSHMDISLLNSI